MHSSRLAYEKLQSKKKHAQLQISMISQLLALTTIFGAIVVPPKPGLAQSFGKEYFLNSYKRVDLNKRVAIAITVQLPINV